MKTLLKDQKTARTAAMDAIYEELLVLNTDLAEERRQTKTLPVIGEGSLFAEIMFIGEAPGKKESHTGKPFCGASGKFLDQLLNSVGIKREDVYITSIVKDRPPKNRDPRPDEIKAYSGFLDRQIDIIQPKVIATLGRFSMVYIMERFGLKDIVQPISALHGHTIKARASYGEITIIPLYHPAVALYNGSTRSVLLEDFKVLKKVV